MSTKPIRILLVEDNPGDARLIEEMLAEADGQDFSIEWVSRLADGLEHMSREQVDVVLLDLGLPDSQGLDTFIKVREQTPHIPIVVLTGLADETLALTALRQGAQDYLFKDETHPHLILRAIRYATERKQAELALEHERQKLYDVLNSLPAFVHLKKPDLTIQFANRRCIEFFGDPGHKPCYEVLQGRSEPCKNCRALEVIKTRKPQKFEWTDPLHDRIFEVYNYPFCTEGEILVLTLGIDITERKQAEEAVSDQEEQLAAIYDNAPLIMMLVDAELRVRMANKMAEECVSADAADLIGRRGGEALQCLYSLDDPEGCGFAPHCQVCRVRCTVIETLKTGESHHQVEATLPFLIDGEPRDITFLLSTARIAVRGENQVLVTIQDITKRKQTEEALRQNEVRMRLAQEAAKIGTFEHDLQTGIITWTPELEIMYGLATGSFGGTYEAFINLIHPDDRDNTGRLLEECITTGGQSEGEWRVIWPDGSIHWIYGRWQVLNNEMGQPARVSGVNIDITGRKEMEEALRQSEASLRHMTSQLLHAQEQERLRIAHELHDDLGQSLMLLKLQLSTMVRDLLPELEKPREQCLNAVDSVKDIIDSVRRLSQDLIPPTLAEIGLKSAINDLLEDFCQHQGIDCAVDIDNPKGLFSTDTELIIYRILQESLTNIGKYAQATRVSISLRIKDQQVCLAVEDNGKGFEVGSIMARRGRQRGLGLASMEERARMLGGTLQITSAPNMGTKIQVNVPLRT